MLIIAIILFTQQINYDVKLLHKGENSSCQTSLLRTDFMHFEECLKLNAYISASIYFMSFNQCLISNALLFSRAIAR